MVLPAAIQESVCFSAECRRGRLGRAATGVFCPFQDVHVVNAVIMERVRVVLMAGSIISIHRAAATRRQRLRRYTFYGFLQFYKRRTLTSVYGRKNENGFCSHTTVLFHLYLPESWNNKSRVNNLGLYINIRVKALRIIFVLLQQSREFDRDLATELTRQYNFADTAGRLPPTY